MAVKRDPYAGWSNYAAGYMGTNAGANSWEPNYQNWQDYATGYKAGHPQDFLSPDQVKYIQAATAPQTPNLPPWDPTYEADVSGINRLHNDTIANLGYEESQLSPSYGYQTDNSGNVSVDPSNPFSKAALLQKTYGENQARSTNSMAAQGQLYSGALQNQQNQNTFGFQQNTDALKRAYSNALQSIRARRTAADTTQYINTNNAGANRLQRALANRPTQ